MERALRPVSMCAYLLRVYVGKNLVLFVFFDCFHVCMIHIGLRDVSVVRETKSLLEQFFHALQTLRTANCMLFNIAMVEIFAIKANIVNNNHTELFTCDSHSYNNAWETLV